MPLIRLLYQFGIFIAASFWLPVYIIPALIRGKYRRGIEERFGIYPEEVRRISEEGRPFWIHAVSVGEIISMIPLVESLKDRFPDVPIIISTITETGRDVATRIMKKDAVIYFPIDLRSCVRRALSIINPRLIIIAETELWPNFMWEVGKTKTPLFLVNGRISDKSYKKYKWIKPFLRDSLRSFYGFFMQSELDAERIISLGAPPERVIVCGNVKYDRDMNKIPDEEIEAIKHSLPFIEKDTIIIAGSTHRGEEEIVIDVLKRLKEKYPSLKLIIAPRHPERVNEVEEILRKSKIRWRRRSSKAGDGDVDVLIIDTIGELSKMYAVGKIIFIGGSLVPHGGHNPIEAAVYNKPVISGPCTNNFRDMYEHLLSSGGAIIIKDGEELHEKILYFLENGDALLRMGYSAKKCIEEKRGAVKKIMASIEKFVVNG